MAKVLTHKEALVANQTYELRTTKIRFDYAFFTNSDFKPMDPNPSILHAML